jgi:ATP-dependent Lon protease
MSEPPRNPRLFASGSRLAIAKHGLDSSEWAIDDEALLLLIRRYTREAGVRNLERELSTLIRKAVKELTLSKKKSVLVGAKNVADYIGVPKFRYGEVENQDHGRYRRSLSEGEADHFAA